MVFTLLALVSGEEVDIWENWSEWSICTRSCDGGVRSRTRECKETNSCHGSSKDYKICNHDPCPESEEEKFRNEQCAQYNDVPHEGQYFLWEAFIDEDNPCSLTCKASGRESTLSKVKSKVMDGTRCSKDSLDLCIDGECQVRLDD